MDPVYGFQAVNVEAQLRTPTSLLRWLRRFIELRKQHPVFGLGDYHVLRPENPKIFAHIRSFSEDIVLCVHNLARTAQAVELDLSAFAGRVPVELLGNTEFPRIGELPVPAHARPARLLLVPAPGSGRRAAATDERRAAHRIEAGDLHFLDGLVLLGTIASQRWFGGKSRDVLDARVLDAGDRPGRPADPRLRDRRGALRPAEPRPLPPAARVPAGRRGLERVRRSRRPGGWTVYDAIADPAARAARSSG